MILPENFVIEQWGGACPYQAYGTFGDERFYFRFRSDNASLSVGPAEEEVDEWNPPMPQHPPRLYAEIFGVTGDRLAGFLSKEEADELMARMVEMLKPPEEWEQGTHRDRMVAFITGLYASMREVPDSQPREGDLP